MRVFAHVKIDQVKLNNLAASTAGIAIRFVDESTAEAVKIAKRNSRVDTEAMRKGWTRRWTGRGRRAGVKIINVRHQFDPLVAEGRVSTFDSDAVTIYNEFGTRFMPAKPMLRPAMRHIRGKIPARAKRLVTLGCRQIISDTGTIVDEGAL
jgi:HK97 gp10 family phage protein